jgi:hypothetical protein
MNNEDQLIIYKEEVFTVGQETVIDSVFNGSVGVVFEDDGETGYFYAVETSNEMQVLDALHIYNVSNVIDKEKPSTIKILWAQDQSKAFLSINGYYHAVFDFKNKAGYCRNGFPETNGDWPKVKERKLTDVLLKEIVKGGS